MLTNKKAASVGDAIGSQYDQDQYNTLAERNAMKDKVIGYIYETFDYGRFRAFPDNREVTRDRLEKLKASISEKYNLCPIIVNNKWQIVDGQGRYEACKELGKPIRYIIDPNARIEDCQRMNKYNRPWALEDFIWSHMKSGKEAFARLYDLREQVKAPYMRIIGLSGIGTRTSEVKERITDGTLQFSQENEDTFRKVYGAAREIAEALCFGKSCNDTFYNAVRIMWNTTGYNHTRMLRNCRQQRGTYEMMANLEAQLKEFSRIYNRGARQDKVYFEDYMRNKGHNVRSYDNNFKPKSYVEGNVSTLKELKTRTK